jgi:antitoxin FitA
MPAFTYPELPMEVTVANLSVRKLDEETLFRLRIRAATHGVSMEEEARRILKDAVSAPERLGDLAVRIFGPKHGVDLQLPTRIPHEAVDLPE